MAGMSSAMIAPPHPLEQAYRCGIFLSFAFGAACSVPSLWERFFQKMDGTPLGGAYARVGEYGETEIKVLWSSFKEPINAWSSLAYCVFGIVICVVGTYDYFEYAHVDAPNRMAQDNGFSVMIGSFLMYLGLTSFLFHASHSADWWKANNGMTSGVMIPLVLFAVWDRVRLPGMHSTIVLSFCSFLLFSLTYGYTPPWSLDLLFPLSVAIVVFSELCPRYGGALHADQYMYFCQCMLCASGGALLRAVDLYRNNTRTRQILLLCYALGLGVYCLLSSFTDDIALCGMVCGALVLFNPARGHACWHWASAYAVYLWWYMLRTRPGNPRTPYGLDRVLVSLLLFAALKNALRRIIMKLPARILAPDYHDRVRLTLEHLVFSLWGYYSIVVVPTQNQSWLYHTVLCWYTPTYPTPGFTLYYIARVAALVEDVLHLWVSGATFSKTYELPLEGEGRAEGRDERDEKEGRAKGEAKTAGGRILEVLAGTGAGVAAAAAAAVGAGAGAGAEYETVAGVRGSEEQIDAMTSKKERFEAERLRQLHHNVAALLSVASLFAGYGKIGSLVILTHDVAEVPLDVFKFVSIKGWRRAQLLSLLATVLTWAYWRMWVFTTVVLASVVRESKSMMDKTTCTPGDCTWLQVPERLPFFICLLVFLFLNVVWLWRMCRIGHRLLFPNSQVDNSSDGSLFNAGNLGSPSPKSQHSHRV